MELAKRMKKNYEDRFRNYLPNGLPVIVRLDGKNFSHMIKNKFQKPFDDDFIRMMNETAEYVCKNVQGCKFAYVQSDEISLLILNDSYSEPWFDNNLSKILSITSSLATAKFNQLMMCYQLNKHTYDEDEIGLFGPNDCLRLIENSQLYQFDSRAFVIPNNEIINYFLYRQNDCLKNSKQQTAQTYLSHKELLGKNTDEQIALLKTTKGVDWNELPNDRKYGRFIWKEEVHLVSDDGYQYVRHLWKTHDGYLLNDEHNREIFHSMNIIPKR